MDAPKTNREIAEKMRDHMKRWIAGTAQIVARSSTRTVNESHFVDVVERALDAKDAALLEADKNGYERGRTSFAGVLEKHNEIGDAIKRDEALLRECWAALETLSERHGDCPDKRCGHNFVCDECVQVASTVDKLKSRQAMSEDIKTCHHFSDGTPIFPARHSSCEGAPMKPTQKQPEPLKNVAVTRREVENFKKSATLPWGLQAVEVMDRLLTERDEAIRERDLAIAHDRQPYPTAEAYERVCKVLAEEKRRAAAYREVAIDLHMEFDCSGKEMACEKVIDAEAQKLLAPSDSGGEKDFKSQQKGDSK